MKKKYMSLMITILLIVISIINAGAQHVTGINPEHMPDTASLVFKTKAADTVKNLKKKPRCNSRKPAKGGYSYEPGPAKSLIHMMERKELLFLLSRLNPVY